MEEFAIEDWKADMLEYYAEDIEMMRPPDKDEFTKEDFCDLMEESEGLEMSIKTADYWLKKAIDDGKVTVRPWRQKGSITNVYRWVND